MKSTLCTMTTCMPLSVKHGGRPEVTLKFCIKIKKTLRCSGSDGKREDK